MALAGEPSKAKLICGIIANRQVPLEEVHALLEKKIGKVEILSEVWLFDMTGYYESQMGADLVRQFAAFEETVNPQTLAHTKCLTNAVEEEFASLYSQIAPRPVNLDPGYITEANLTLASMKAFSHRIYLSDGVYGEVTLLYHKGVWEPLKWTFPDYASGRYDEFLTRARHSLRRWKKGLEK